MIFEGFKILSTPDDYVTSEVNTIKGESALDSIYSPGQWYRYCYIKNFNTKGGKNYVHHASQTGARQVPANKEGKRKCGAWEFDNAGLENADKYHRRGYTTRNLFPEEMSGQLNEEVLTTLRLTAD